MTDTFQFSDFALKPSILETLKTIGYEQPSPIQEQAIPCLLKGHDVLGMAQTGTGKTAAFALPVLNAIDLKSKKPQALVLTPTRELAIQVAEAFQKYAHNLPGFHVLPVYGGQSMSTQLRALDRGTHVIVGTPGRIMDHLRRKSLDLSVITHVVLDEADEMLRMGFIEDVEWILEHAPKERQTALFSATMPKQIQKVAETYLVDPVTIAIQSKTTTVTNIDQQGWIVKGVNKLDALTRILEIEEFDGVLIFVRTKTATVELAEKLEARGYATSPLNGDMNQTLRERTVERLKNGKLDIVVATDVAARGIDVPRISHVINYDIPYDTEAYVHRIGRTGRAGRSGKAILFIAPREQRMLQSIERATRQPITMMQLPSKEQIASHRINQFKQSVLDVLNTEDLDFFSSLIMDMCKEQSVLPEDLAKAFAFMAQKQNPVQLPAREEREIADSRDRSDRGERSDRSERSDRGDRFDRGAPRAERSERSDPSDREDRPKRSREPSDIDMVNYRIEAGREHGVMPKDIVGAIVNEVQISRESIGHIRLFENFSTVELPRDMPKELLAHLKKVRVKSQRMDISVDKGPGGKKDDFRSSKSDDFRSPKSDDFRSSKADDFRSSKSDDFRSPKTDEAPRPARKVDSDKPVKRKSEDSPRPALKFDGDKPAKRDTLRKVSGGDAPPAKATKPPKGPLPTKAPKVRKTLSPSDWD